MTVHFAERLHWQQVLFAEDPRRRDLLDLHAPWELTSRRIRVHRNHMVEHALHIARPYLEYAGIRPEWLLGGYDDSLALAIDGAADVEVVWLDYERLAARLGVEEAAAWLAGRLGALRERSDAPIIALDWDGRRDLADAFARRLRQELRDVDDVRVADRSEIFGSLGDRYFDAERASMTGTRMSALAAVMTGRLLGARELPAALVPRLKAVVVDLDNTLYRGVLGEDGPQGVDIGEGHVELQRLLRALHDEGVLLGMLSRNEPADVEELFGARTDLPLELDTFDARSIGWQPKAEGIADLAATFRIDPSAIVFVDDNPGELLGTLERIPALHIVHAPDDGAVAARALGWFPALWGYPRTETERVRGADLRANRERERSLLRADDDLGAYYRELGVRLTVSHDQADELPRIAELSGKTNQFNLALSRLTLARLKTLLADDSRQVGAVRLEDRLTDSGLIGMALAQRDGDTLRVDELCISCRALGRRLEDQMIAQMITAGPLFPGVRRVVFSFVDGPRNEPARRWLEGFAHRDLPQAPERIGVMVGPAVLEAAAVNPHVEVRAREH